MLLGEKGPLGRGSRTMEVWALRKTGSRPTYDLRVLFHRPEWNGGTPAPLALRKQPGAKAQTWAWCPQSQDLAQLPIPVRESSASRRSSLTSDPVLVR